MQVDIRYLDKSIAKKTIKVAVGVGVGVGVADRCGKNADGEKKLADKYLSGV